MHPGERANLPQWRGEEGFLEIWFVVVFDAQSGEAWWFRYTLMAPAKGRDDKPRAIVWGAAFRAGEALPALYGKRVHPITDFDAGPRDAFHVRIGDADIGHGFLRGSVDTDGGQLAWDLRFQPSPKPASRTPSLLHMLPLPARASHVHAEVFFEGTVSMGEGRTLRRAVGLQMHLHGTRQVEELAWVHSALFQEDPSAVLEVIETRLDRKVGPVEAPRITSIFLRHRDGVVDDTGASTMLRPTVTSPGPGLLDVVSRSPTRVVKVRAMATPERCAGYVYRDPVGREVYVAQSDVASAVVEVFSRKRPWGAWRPERSLTSAGTTALEFHAPEAIEGVAYIPWEAERVGERGARGATAGRSGDGEVEMPDAPGEIFALGLTYRAHIRETGGDPERDEPVVFRKNLRAWKKLDGEGVVRVPGTRAMCDALDVVEPGLGATLEARHAFLPALMDWEGELGMLLLDDATGDGDARVAWFVANDLTARCCQVMGEGTREPLRLWEVAKGFEGFLPVTSRAWVAPEGQRERWPDVTLVTRVNGAEKQRSHVRDMVGTPREMLRRVAKLAGRPLRAGDVVLTGTPAGVAFRVAPWKRKVGDVLLDRFGKLDAAIGMYVDGVGFLKPGDRVEIDGGVLGSVRVRMGVSGGRSGAADEAAHGT